MIRSGLRPYVNVIVVGVLGAVLAFAGSFLVHPTYVATTRLLIHGRDATFLSSTGQDLTAQPGVVDSSLSQSLAATYAGIATSRTLASGVVDTLHLDTRPLPTGPVADISRAFAWVYRCTKAFVTSGFCDDVSRAEQATNDVQDGITAAPLGTNAGSTAGQNSSYVLELQASGGTADDAKAITDAVADQLVASSATRFKSDAAKSIAGLQAQLAAAQKDADTSSRALADYQTAHGISAADGKLALSASTYESIHQDLLKAQAQEADLKAQLASINASLASVPQSQQQNQTIVTGRSTTQLNSTSASTVYSDLVSKQRDTQAQIDGQTARVAQLQSQLSGSTVLSTRDNATLADLTNLGNAVELAQKNVADLSGSLQKARTTEAQNPVDLTRLDTATAPTYPTSPKRYIYLLLGLLVGAVGGASLTAYAARRRPVVPVAAEATPTPIATPVSPEVGRSGLPERDDTWFFEDDDEPLRVPDEPAPREPAPMRGALSDNGVANGERVPDRVT